MKTLTKKGLAVIASLFIFANLQAQNQEELFIEQLDEKEAIDIQDKLPTGKIFFKTNPNNAYVDFNREGLSPRLTSSPIEMNAGEYNVRITKIGYLPIDTIVIVPSNESTKIINISLKQDFAKIQLNITSPDNFPFQTYPVIDIDTAHIDMAVLFDKTKLKSFDDDGSVEYFKLYKGGYIPVPAGTYNIRINAPGFQTHSTIISTTKGVTSPLAAKLQAITGNLTIIDTGNADGARVGLNDQEIGVVPLLKHKVRVGTYKLTFAKPGYFTPEAEYKLTITENMDKDFSISMNVLKEYYISTTPTEAEISVDGRHEGFTPTTIYLKGGTHKLTVKKAGYLDEFQDIKISKIEDSKSDTIRYDMRLNYPIAIESEAEGLKIFIKKEGKVISSGNKTPSNIRLPYGKYTLELEINRQKRFSGSFIHDGKTSVLAPSYSYGTFTGLVGDYFFGRKMIDKGVNDSGKKDSKYSLLADVHFGRFILFPGLSTSIFRTSIFEVNKDFKGQIVKAEKKNKEGEIISANVDDEKYNDYMFSGSCMFLNGEFRVGGSILKELDVCLLGSCAWYPPLTSMLVTKMLPLNHVDGSEMFFGIEVSSRISCLNANIKLGKEIYNGNYNFRVDKKEDDTKSKFSSQGFDFNGVVLSIGFTLGRHISRGNNMLRAWYKPLVSNY